MGWFSDDICWCANSTLVGKNGCDKVECFRHMSHRKPQPQPDIFTCGALKGTSDCPYHKEIEKAEKITFGRNKWYCSKCGSLIDIEDNFCSNCGRKFIQSMNEYL